jgi:solute carrier family 35, member F5
MLNAGGVAEVTAKIVGFVCANGFADTVLADYFWARAVVLTSPTVATIGMSITIPIAILTDYFIDGIQATGLACFGAVLVVIGFVLVNMTNEHVEWMIQKVRHVCNR